MCMRWLLDVRGNNTQGSPCHGIGALKAQYFLQDYLVQPFMYNGARYH